MVRARSGKTVLRGRKRLRRLTKGFVMSRHNLYRQALVTLIRGRVYAFRDRMAKELGLFERRGLDVDLSLIDGGAPSAAALVSNQTQVGNFGGTDFSFQDGRFHRYSRHFASTAVRPSRRKEHAGHAGIIRRACTDCEPPASSRGRCVHIFMN